MKYDFPVIYINKRSPDTGYAVYFFEFGLHILVATTRRYGSRFIQRLFN